MITVCRTTDDLRAFMAQTRRAGKTSALVPTMGALHAGHVALMHHAATLADAVIATLFVNPTQFGPNEDLERYPRREAADVAAMNDAGVAAVFVPSVDEMYGPLDATRISVGGPAEGLESAFRPHFFGGVATVVSRLLNAAGCDHAVFGEKDYQQLLVIRRMAEDLKIPTAIHGAPTVRGADGLALSSRNAYLSEEERAAAPNLYAALCACRDALHGGMDPQKAVGSAERSLQASGFKPDYVALRDAETLGPCTELRRGRLLAAAWLGSTRLIDNISTQAAKA